MVRIRKFLHDSWITAKSLFVGSFWRLVRSLLPGRSGNADFAFLVHPRGAWDTWKPLPLLGYLPKRATEWWGEVFPAVEIARMEFTPPLSLVTVQMTNCRNSAR